MSERADADLVADILEARRRIQLYLGADRFPRRSPSA